jgi:type II secretory pathway component PulF
VKIGYRGFDSTGKAVRGSIDANDSREAIELLRRQNIFATETFAGDAIAAMREQRKSEKIFDFGKQARVELVADMLRQLALLIATGTPVVEALTGLERQVKDEKFLAAICGVRKKVEEGRTLADAMGDYPDYFDAVCRSLCAAGESGGKLEEMLERLSKMLRQQVKVHKAIRGAMVYPVLLIVVATAVLGAMVGFVLPRFEGLFESMDAALPPMTKVLMEMSHFLRAYWPFVVGGLFTTAIGSYVALRTPKGRRVVDVALVTTPKVGVIARRLCASRLARVLGTLMEGRVPLIEALALAKHSVANSLYVELIEKAEDAVLRGETLSSGLDDPKLLTPTLVEAVRSGERAGRLAPVLSTVAEHLDEDNEVALRTLTTIMEPVILIVLGIIVGFMAVGMLLPLFDLTAGAGGGA